jgi:hypothetical protein
MKKVLFSVAVVSALILASCGGPSVCDCLRNSNAEKPDEFMTKKCKEEKEKVGTDEAKAKAYAEELSKCK